MHKKQVRATVFKETHDKVKRLARFLRITVPEAYQRLEVFGNDSLKRQKILLDEFNQRQAEEQEDDLSEMTEAPRDES
jgi:hypothetical protein